MRRFILKVTKTRSMVNQFVEIGRCVCVWFCHYDCRSSPVVRNPFVSHACAVNWKKASFCRANALLKCINNVGADFCQHHVHSLQCSRQINDRPHQSQQNNLSRQVICSRLCRLVKRRTWYAWIHWTGSHLSWRLPIESRNHRRLWKGYEDRFPNFPSSFD